MMKKNLLSFIGSLVALISIFLLGTPYLVYTYDNHSSSTSTVISIQSLLGITDKSYDYSSYFTMGGILLTVSLFFAFATLIIVLIGNLQKKDVNDKALILSSISAFTVFYFIKFLSNTLSQDVKYSTKYSIGWGIVCVLVLFAAFFVLTLIGFILSFISDSKTTKDKNLDDIYKFKKLFDEGIITKEEFDEKKKQLLQ